MNIIRAWGKNNNDAKDANNNAKDMKRPTVTPANAVKGTDSTDSEGKKKTTTFITITPSKDDEVNQQHGGPGTSGGNSTPKDHTLAGVFAIRRESDLPGSPCETSGMSTPAHPLSRPSSHRFRRTGQALVALLDAKSHSSTFREQVEKTAHHSAHKLGAFFGTEANEQEMNKWKQKWDKECKHGVINLPKRLSIVRGEKSKDDILKKLEKTVHHLTEETEIEDSRLLEQIASEDDVAPMHFYNPHATDVFQQLHRISTHQQPVLDEDSEHPLRQRLSSSDELVTGHEAYEQYKMLIQLEKQDIMKKLKHKKELALAKLTWQERMLDNVRHLATEYYRNPTGPAAKEWKALRLEVKNSEFTSNLGIQTKLAELPTYFPFFTYLIVLAQLIAFIVIMCLGGVTKVGAEPERLTRKHQTTFLGTQEVQKFTIPNLWIGPDYKFFIGIGAVYAPCMRTDNLRQHEYIRRNYTRDIKLGCCEVRKRNVAGTTTEQECAEFTYNGGNWTAGTVCSKRQPGQNSVAHEFRPCCIGSRGQCYMMSHAHCDFVGGVRSMKWEHCSTVNCLDSTCGMGKFTPNPVLKWQAENPNQWWRFLLAILYHPGIIQCVLVLAGEIMLMKQLESIAGWLRVVLIYFACCFASYAAAAAFEPYTPHMGSAGALSGILGVSFIEMLQSWPIIKKPWIELLKFLGIVTFMLLSGTLPFLNNYGLVFGFLTGILTGVIILPFITFGKWSAMCRRIIIVIALPLLIILFVLLFYTMYKIQTLNTCRMCNAFNCVNYTSNICNYIEMADEVNPYVSSHF